jgi:hypothetical protein
MEEEPNEVCCDCYRDIDNCVCAKQDFDADMAYERYREMWGDRLYETLSDTYNAFVKTKEGYYKDDDTKFFEHVISILESLTDCHIELNGKMITARRNK